MTTPGPHLLLYIKSMFSLQLWHISAGITGPWHGQRFPTWEGSSAGSCPAPRLVALGFGFGFGFAAATPVQTQACSQLSLYW